MYSLEYDFTQDSITNKQFCGAEADCVWIAFGDFSTNLPTQIHRKDILNLKVYFGISAISAGNMTPLNSAFQGAYGECCKLGMIPYSCDASGRNYPEDFVCTERITGNWILRKLNNNWWPKAGESYLVWEFNGTIEDLLGRSLKPGEKTLTFVELVTTNLNVYLVIEDERRAIIGTAWHIYASESKIRDITGPTLDWTVQILDPIPEPSPPEPIFVADLCSSPTGELTPDGQFNILVTIANQNQYYGGNYYIGSYCQGHYIDLGSGTISAGQQITQTLTTTPNALAGTQITESQYLPYAVVTGYVDAGVKHETDRWNPTPLAVIVGPVPECTPGETKCVGYDLYTCNAAKAWELTEKNAGQCGYIVCTIDADCPEGYVCKDGKCVKKAFPWEWLAIGGAVVAGSIMILTGMRK